MMTGNLTGGFWTDAQQQKQTVEQYPQMPAGAGQISPMCGGLNQLRETNTLALKELEVLKMTIEELVQRLNMVLNRSVFDAAIQKALQKPGGLNQTVAPNEPAPPRSALLEAIHDQIRLSGSTGEQISWITATLRILISSLEI